MNEIHLKSVDSTNTWAKTHRLLLDHQKITCITADTQTAGRGRYGHTWFSPDQENIYATFFFCMPTKKNIFFNLTQLLCLSCIKVLIQFPIHPKIKWPNDILIKDKKIAGILCEIVEENNTTCVVLGVGININSSPSTLMQIDRPATSLFAETLFAYDRNQIIAGLKRIFFNDLTEFLQKGFAPFHRIYESLLREVGKNVIVDETHEALCDSVTPEGKLKLFLPSGKSLESISEKIRLVLP